jgi:thiol peroxidase
MTTITLKGNTIHTIGNLPEVGTQAPNFSLTKTNLSEMSLADCSGKKTILNIFPSIDTPTCATSVRHFNEAANKLNNTLILCVSADLPFAQTRFCGAEGLDRVTPVSVFRHPDFGQHYGVTITDGPLTGLLSRAIVILDETGKVIYTQQVAEIADEPDYDDALAALS